MVLASDYPFMDVFWSMIIFFAWLAWIWIAITCFADIFRRRDIGGFAKTMWCIFIILVPFLGVFVYLLAEHDGMAERSMKDAQTQKAQFDDYVRSVGGGSAAEIEKAHGLLQSGAITQAEFDAIKAKALAAA